MELIERVAALETASKEQRRDIDSMGGTVDHILETIDTDLTPKVDRHDRDLEEAKKTIKDVEEYVFYQRGAWQFIQRVGIVIAAIAGAWTIILRVIEHFK